MREEGVILPSLQLEADCPGWISLVDVCGLHEAFCMVWCGFSDCFSFERFGNAVVAGLAARRNLLFLVENVGSMASQKIKRLQLHKCQVVVENNLLDGLAC